MTKIFKGIIPPAITCFDKDGNFDEAAQREVIRFQAKYVDGFYPCGTYGSGPLMTAEERKRVAQIVVEEKGAKALAAGKILGWFQGKMEFGPRALGNRSILADPRRSEMKDILNKKVKHREGFRPFAPSVLIEHCAEYFDSGKSSPFMLMVYNVLADKRAVVPAITHVDGTGRVQTVDKYAHPRYRKLIEEFNKLTGIPMVLNTSFNTKGEPMNNSPEDAIKTFLNSEMDVLIIGDYYVEKSRKG